MTGSSIGAVVIAYRNDDYRRVIEDLLEQGMDREAIVVVRNPHPDDSGPLRPPQDVPVIEMPVNRVYGPAMNAGIEHHAGAGRGWAFLLTSDVRLRPGALTAMARASQQAHDFGALGPILRTPDGEPFSFGSAPGDDGDVAHREEPPPATDCDSIAEAGYIDGAAILARIEAFEQAGPFAEKWFMYYEETDWLLRVRRAEWRVGVVLAAEGEQEPGVSNRPGVTAYTFMRNGIEFGRLAGGTRGAGRAFGHQLLRTRGSLKTFVVGPGRRTAGAELVGASLGLLAFVTRRWGPPPRWLPGSGDVRR